MSLIFARLSSVKSQVFIILFLCVMMFVGMLYGRAILSIAMVLLFINALLPKQVNDNWRRFRKNKVVHVCLAFYLIYFISGLWSENKIAWGDEVFQKLQFILLPFALLSLPYHNKRFISLLHLSIQLIAFSGIIFSFVKMGLNGSKIQEHVHFITPMLGDYLRFSLFLVLTILMSLYNLKNSRFKSQGYKVFQIIVIAILFLYIHLLASKSGILFLYLALIIFFIHATYRSNKVLAVTSLSGLGLLLVILFFTIPTFQFQFNKLKRDFNAWHYNQQSVVDNYYGSYVGRMRAYRVVSEIIIEHPLLGVGAGDTKDEVSKIYYRDYPKIKKAQHFGPHNQFLSTAASVGIPGSILIIGAFCLVPFFYQKKRNNVFFTITLIIMALFFFIESLLEIQFGAFLFLFFLFYFKYLPTTQLK